MVQQVRQALQYLPQEVRQAIMQLPTVEKLEEIRLRRGQAIACLSQGAEERLPIVTREELISEVVDIASERSGYAVQEMLKKGFLALGGGHRLGVCGTGVYQRGELQTLRDISSLNLRIARQIRGAADSVADRLWLLPQSSLIIGAPACGKTTLLRDLIRQMSERFGFRIGVVDERMELSGGLEFDLGSRTDVLSGVRKETAIEMLLRSMNPEWIALDEITAFEDVEAMLRASYCGVRFLATAHASDVHELRARPVYRRLLSSGLFSNLIVIGKRRSIHMEVLTDA